VLVHFVYIIRKVKSCLICYENQLLVISLSHTFFIDWLLPMQNHYFIWVELKFSLVPVNTETSNMCFMCDSSYRFVKAESNGGYLELLFC